MPRPARLSVLTSCLLLALSIALYFVFYLKSSFHSQLDSTFAKSNQAAIQQESLGELGYVLSPLSHRNRAAKKIHVHLNVTSGYRYPDGVKKHVFLLNGDFPGPTIEARSGDVLEIQVYNNLDKNHGEGLAIHWHGLIIPNDMDGVVGVTQRAIRRHQSFTYHFQIHENQSGTFWYHAHSHVQRADGMYGALIIHKPAIDTVSEQQEFNYDHELLLLIGDLYHQPATDILNYYQNYRNFGIEPAPDSLLINGIGRFNCSKAVPARPLDCKGSSLTNPYLTLKSNRTRLRVVNTGALTGFTLSLSGYSLSLIQVDGGNRVAKTKLAESIGILYPGERIDIVVQRKELDSSVAPQIGISLDNENMRFPNLALTANQSFPLKGPGLLGEVGSGISPDSHLDLSSVSGAINADEDVPTTTGSTFLFYTKIEILAQYENTPKGFINRTSWPLPESDSLPLIELTPLERKQRAYVPSIQDKQNKWVDVVINNLDELGHPFHLHGTSFFVLASHKSKSGAYEAYNPFDTSEEPASGPMNVVDPVMRDTIFVPRMGYVVLRFLADNKGIWLLHCHVLWHEMVGMAMALQIGED